MTGIAAFRWGALSRTRRAVGIVISILILLAIAVWIATIVLRPKLPSAAELTAASRQQAGLTGGAKAYAARCAYCHATGFGPPISGQDMAIDAVETVVRKGPGAMPAFAPSQVSDSDLAAVTEYINALPVRDTHR